MEAPKCRTCGERHWSRVCSVTKNVTLVTKNVTKTDPEDVGALHAEIARLRAELASLRRVLEIQKVKTAMTGAERMRKLRERKRNA